MPNNNKVILGWGECKIKVEAIDGTGATVTGDGFFPTPVENSTQLTTNKGTKMEAPVEGGGNEGIKYTRGSYAVEFQCRRAAGRVFPVEDLDTVVTGEFKLTVIPENEDAPGLQLPRCVITVDDGFTSKDGGTVKYVCETLIPEDKGKQLRWGTYSSGQAAGSGT